jgi:hypothetical protein
VRGFVTKSGRFLEGCSGQTLLLSDHWEPWVPEDQGQARRISILWTGCQEWTLHHSKKSIFFWIVFLVVDLILVFSYQDLRTLFDRIDLDGSDNLDLPEVIIFFKSITDDLSMENIERIFKKLDEDGNKVLDFGEFKESLLI